MYSLITLSKRRIQLLIPRIVFQLWNFEFSVCLQGFRTMRHWFCRSTASFNNSKYKLINDVQNNLLFNPCLPKRDHLGTFSSKHRARKNSQQRQSRCKEAKIDLRGSIVFRKVQYCICALSIAFSLLLRAVIFFTCIKATFSLPTVYPSNVLFPSSFYFIWRTFYIHFENSSMYLKLA